ncbi:MAG TPA: ATP-dependent protease subunit HslV [Bacteroidota bacterium]|nr:ATP-dependent protease subunit HslV [Bacteroidota bacterium]
MTDAFHSTTVLGLTHNGTTCIGADGQVTVGATVMKHNARKIRRLYNGTVLAGFAGAAADAFTLFSRFEDNLEKYHGNLERAAVELARDWRTDKYLRQLEALLAVLDGSTSLVISGTGEIIEPDDGILAIGSGGSYALAAARMLVAHSSLGTREIVDTALRAAAAICIYTNDHITIEEL